MNVAIVYKDLDSFTPSAPWCADVVTDGNEEERWFKWSSGFKTRKALLDHIEACGSIDQINC